MFLCSGFLISRFGTGGKISNSFINNSVQIGFMLFPFIGGALSSKHDIFKKMKKIPSKYSGHISLLLIIFIIIIKCFIHTAAINPIYAFSFITLYLFINKSWISSVLKYIGKHSMNIWMTHTWLMVYIFSDFFYSFKNPILILTMVLIVCLIISNLTNVLIKNLFYSKK